MSAELPTESAIKRTLFLFEVSSRSDLALAGGSELGEGVKDFLGGTAVLVFLAFSIEAGVSKLVLGNRGGSGDEVAVSGTEDDEVAEEVPDSDTDATGLLAKQVINWEIERV